MPTEPQVKIFLALFFSSEISFKTKYKAGKLSKCQCKLKQCMRIFVQLIFEMRKQHVADQLTKVFVSWYTYELNTAHKNVSVFILDQLICLQFQQREQTSFSVSACLDILLFQREKNMLCKNVNYSVTDHKQTQEVHLNKTPNDLLE